MRGIFRMARVTIADCIDKVENQFELVALAAQRAKDINSGAAITIDRNKDKDAVIALREIAIGHIKTDNLREELIRRLQTRSRIDQIDDENLDIENAAEDFNYVSGGADLHVSEDYSDLDNDQMFSDDIIDEGDEKGF